MATRRTGQVRKGRGSAGKRKPTLGRSLRIHVVWHESYADGSRYAKEIFRWFRGTPDDLARCGSGVPVEYEVAAAGASDVELPDFDAGEVHLVVLLIDREFALSTALRRAMDALTRTMRAVSHSDEHIVPLPVGIHESAFSQGGVVASRNFIRLDVGATDPKESEDARWQRRRDRLLGQITQFAARMIAATEESSTGIGFRSFDPSEPPRKLSVFVSHAKVDGRQAAEQIRVDVLRHGQLEVFFDETDISVGSDWVHALEIAARQRNGAMLVLFTDQYPSRSWCVREVRSARFAVAQGNSARGRVFTFVPVRILDALSSSESIVLSEFSGIPIQRHDPGRIASVIDALVRDVVLQAHFAVIATSIVRDGHADVAIACPPDVYLVSSVLSSSPARRNGGRSVFAFPGRGVGSETVDVLARLFPRWDFRRLEEIEVRS